MLSCPYLVCRKISSKKHYDVSEIFVSLFPNSSETANPNELRFWLYPRRGKDVGLWCPPPARVRHLDSQMGGVSAHEYSYCETYQKRYVTWGIFHTHDMTKLTPPPPSCPPPAFWNFSYFLIWLFNQLRILFWMLGLHIKDVWCIVKVNNLFFRSTFCVHINYSSY